MEKRGKPRVGDYGEPVDSSGGSDVVHQPVGNGLSGHFKKRLREILGKRIQPCSIAGCQDQALHLVQIFSLCRHDGQCLHRRQHVHFLLRRQRASMHAPTAVDSFFHSAGTMRQRGPEHRHKRRNLHQCLHRRQYVHFHSADTTSNACADGSMFIFDSADTTANACTDGSIFRSSLRRRCGTHKRRNARGGRGKRKGTPPRHS